MRKLVLYIATSLDGFIARHDGSVDWLESVPNPDQLDYGYEAFYTSIDTTLMGHTTYQTVIGFGNEFPYADKINYVFSRSAQADAPFVQYVTEDPVTFVKSLKTNPGKTIWLIGGSQLNTVLLRADLIDELIVTIVPILLGRGIPLLNDFVADTVLRLAKTEPFETGFVQLTYVPVQR